MKISGIMTIRNGLEVGYPFPEAIHSVCPLVDEFLINDGGSDDGTWKALCKLSDLYPEIELYQIEDHKSEKWETIDEQLEELIDEAEGDWLIEAQGDEIWDKVWKVRDLLEEIHEDYNSVRQPRYDISSWTQVSYVMQTVRIVENLDGLRSYEGGDNFQIGDDRTPREGYTCHNVQPEYEWDQPFYHFVSVFDDHAFEKSKRHAKWLATEHEIRGDNFEEARKNRNT